MINDRNSSVELLRIIAMIFVVSSHFSVHSGFDINQIADESITNAVFLQISTLGYVGIDIFMCIYGYYNILQNSYVITIKRVIRIWLVTIFYSATIYLIFIMLNYEVFSLKNCIKAFFPISFDEYGFPTLYIIVSLITPFINSGLINLTKSNRRSLALTVLVMWSIIPTLSLGYIKNYEYQLVDYILLYCVGALMRLKFDTLDMQHVVLKKLGGVLFSLSVFSMITVALVYVIFHRTYSVVIPSISVFLFRCSPISIMATIGLVLIFTSIELKSKWVNLVASLTFGVYLIHDNNYVRLFLWRNLIKSKQYAYKNLLPVYELSIVVIVFIVCCLIELLRKKLFDKFFRQISERITFACKRVYIALYKK